MHLAVCPTSRPQDTVLVSRGGISFRPPDAAAHVGSRLGPVLINLRPNYRAFLHADGSNPQDVRRLGGVASQVALDKGTIGSEMRHSDAATDTGLQLGPELI